MSKAKMPKPMAKNNPATTPPTMAPMWAGEVELDDEKSTGLVGAKVDEEEEEGSEGVDDGDSDGDRGGTAALEKALEEEHHQNQAHSPGSKRYRLEEH
ncbi:hypothetical protein HK104_010779 [Borealophlyctis nickersoniae]|nr:hypothetical protein HK104_010779 [Borealophlyctis nickersoniae]